MSARVHRGSSSHLLSFSFLRYKIFEWVRVGLLNLDCHRNPASSKQRRAPACTNRRDPELPKRCQSPTLEAISRETRRETRQAATRGSQPGWEDWKVFCSPTDWTHRSVKDSGPAGPGFCSGSWMILPPFLERYFWRFADTTRLRDVNHQVHLRSNRIYNSKCKSVSLFCCCLFFVFSSFRPKIFLELHISVFFFGRQSHSSFSWPHQMVLNYLAVDAEGKNTEVKKKSAATDADFTMTFLARLAALFLANYTRFPSSIALKIRVHLCHLLHLLCKNPDWEKNKTMSTKNKEMSFFYSSLETATWICLVEVNELQCQVLSLFYFFILQQKKRRRNIWYFLQRTLNSEATPSCVTLTMLSLTEILMFCFSFLLCQLFSFYFNQVFFLNHCMQPAPRMPLIDTQLYAPPPPLTISTTCAVAPDASPQCDRSNHIKKKSCFFTCYFPTFFWHERGRDQSEPRAKCRHRQPDFSNVLNISYFD